MTLANNYHECQIEVKAVIPGSLNSFIYAYCKTVGCPESLEPYFIRKSVSFVKMSKYVVMNLASDFDLWYRKNQESPDLMQVLARIIKDEDGRTETYCQCPMSHKLYSSPFTISGCSFELVLVTR